MPAVRNDTVNDKNLVDLQFQDVFCADILFSNQLPKSWDNLAFSQ